MAQTIQLKRSSVSGNVPTTAQLALGEIAINTADGKVFIKKDDGGVETIVEVTGAGGISQTIIDSAAYAGLEELLDSQVLTALATSQFVADQGFLTSVSESDVTQYESALTITLSQISDFAETDPVFTASASSGITAQDITDWNDAADNYTSLPEVGLNTGDLTGWPNRTDATLSFDDSTRTLTISPVGASFTIWYKGNEIVISTDKTFQIPDSYGSVYINFDGNGDLFNAGQFGDIRDGLLTAYVFWDDVNQEAMVFGDERHSYKRDTEWHFNQHRNLGAVWRSGGSIGFTLDDDTAVSLDVSDVSIADEDLQHDIANSASPSLPYQQVLSPVASIPILVYIGSQWQQLAATSLPWLPAVGDAAQFNPIVGGVGSLDTVANNTFVSYWLLYTNDTRFPVKLVAGHFEHATLDAALGEEFQTFGINLAEQVPAYHIILSCKTGDINNAARAEIKAVRRIEDRTNTTNLSTFSATNHQGLTGTSAENCHPIAAITGLQTALDGKEPSITKSTGYARWNGSAFAFDDVTIPTALTDFVTEGTLDQVLVTDGAGNYAFDSIKIPAGGGEGATLVKASGNDYDVVWQEPPAIEPGLYLIETFSGESASYTGRNPDILDYAGLDVRLVFQSINGGGFAADTQIDNIDLDGNLYDFENTTHNWQTSNGNSYLNYFTTVFVAMTVEQNNTGLWQVTSGNTPSNGTGNLGAQSGSFFMYVESSNPASATGYSIWARSPVVTLGQNPTLSYFEGREGGDIGTINVYLEVV